MTKYKAFTLLELTIVIVILIILSSILVVSYRSLVDSFSINEVSLAITQDIRGVQRSAMMLERNADERWLHGIGLDFGRIETDGEYDIFKWCSEYDYYDESKKNLTNVVPNLGSGEIVEMSVISLETAPSCLTKGRDDARNVRLITETRRVSDYDNLVFSLMGNVRFIVFESVSGKTFFYDAQGRLLNYSTSGLNQNQLNRILSGQWTMEHPSIQAAIRNGSVRITLNSSQLLERFDLQIEPMRKIDLTSRSVLIAPVSGMMTFEFNKEYVTEEGGDDGGWTPPGKDGDKTPPGKDGDKTPPGQDKKK